MVATEEFIKQIDEMTVLELNNLVKALEEHYGVSAAAAAVAAVPGQAAERCDGFGLGHVDVAEVVDDDGRVGVLLAHRVERWQEVGA